MIDTYVEDGPTHVENHGTFFDVIYIPAPSTDLEGAFIPTDGEDSLSREDVLVSKFRESDLVIDIQMYKHYQIHHDPGDWGGGSLHGKLC